VVRGRGAPAAASVAPLDPATHLRRAGLLGHQLSRPQAPASTHLRSVVQRLREEDRPVLKKFKQLVFQGGNWIGGLDYLRTQYGIGTAKEYEFEIGNLEEGQSHHFAVTGLHPRQPKVLVTVDTRNLLQQITGNEEGGFAALVSTLRHEYAHVLQYNELLAGVNEGSVGKKDVEAFHAKEDLHEFLAYSEELLQSYTQNRGALKMAPHLIGDDLELAYTRAVKHYRKMDKTDKGAQKARYAEMKEIYGYLVEAQLFPFKAEVAKLEGLVGKEGFDEQTVVVQDLIPTIPESYQDRLVEEVQKVQRALESHDKAKSKPKPKPKTSTTVELPKVVVKSQEKPKPKRRREKEEEPKIVLVSEDDQRLNAIRDLLEEYRATSGHAKGFKAFEATLALRDRVRSALVVRQLRDDLRERTGSWSPFRSDETKALYAAIGKVLG
jgi:hypothetical protein